MKELNLSKCKTNEEVCKLVAKRVREISFEDLLLEVNNSFVYHENTVRAVYTGLSMNMNVFLSGPGGYGKSTIVKHILDIYKIPYHTVIGYKDMPVDALLGIPNMDKLLKDSEYEIDFSKSIFCTPGVLIGEEFTDLAPHTATALKDILTERGFRDKKGKTESLISCMIICANKSAIEVSDDVSKLAFYEERFPIIAEVTWKSFAAKNYFALLRKHFKDADDSLLYFMAKLFEYNHTSYNNTISPRLAINITSVYLSQGIDYITNFSLNVSHIHKIKQLAAEELDKANIEKTFNNVLSYIDEGSRDEQLLMALYTYKFTGSIVVDNESSMLFSNFKTALDIKIESLGKDSNDITNIKTMLEPLHD